MAMPNVHTDATKPPITRQVTSQGDEDALHELLTVDEVAALLKVSRSWIYEHTRSRGVPRSERLPHVKVGKYVRFDACIVRQFLVKQTRMG
jgi:excisionase family DNA binding protein